MSNKKESSVEWYANEENKLFTSYQKGLMSTAKYILFKYKLREQAKAMHKEEIINANFDGQRLHAKSVTNLMMEDNAEQYYNETFGGNNDNN